MADLKERRHTESLCELCAEARKGRVVKKDIALHFFGNIFHRARVRQAERLSPRLEVVVRVSQCDSERVGCDRGPEAIRRLLSHGHVE